jgi:hypothetical protein
MIGLVIFIGGLLSLLTIRLLWVQTSVERYVFNTFYWISRTQPPKKTVGEITELWPLFYMMVEVWNWNFKRYVVHHDHYEEMKKFIVREMRREHLDIKDLLGDIKNSQSQENDSDSISKQD